MFESEKNGQKKYINMIRKGVIRYYTGLIESFNEISWHISHPLGGILFDLGLSSNLRETMGMVGISGLFISRPLRPQTPGKTNLVYLLFHLQMEKYILNINGKDEYIFDKIKICNIFFLLLKMIV